MVDHTDEVAKGEGQSQEGCVLLPREDPSAEPRQRTVVRSLALAAAAVAVGVLCVATLGSPVKRSTAVEEAVQLAEAAPAGSCPLPKDFCQDKRKNTLSYRDCDNDGILDPYCEGGQLLRFGYLSSKNGCKNNWPNGVCKKAAEPGKSGSEFSHKKAAPNEITVIHFNDVYEVSGVLDHGIRRGGMSRAAYVIETERKRNPDRTFVVFAGDLLSPSSLSDLFKGAHMVDVLNDLKLDAASLGNHEFDFGVDNLVERIGESKFPWLNSNLFDETGALLKGTKERLIKSVPFTPAWSKEEKEAKVCLFGVAYDVRKSIYKDQERIKHEDVVKAADKEADHLRYDEGCDVVLALTHQFSREDCTLSKTLGRKLDLILGGHDHSTELTSVCGHAPYVKADSDLKTQWVMSLFLDERGRVESVDGRLLSLTDVDPFMESVHEKVLKWEIKGEKAMGEVIGCSSVDLDAVGKHVRQEESNAGNFFADSMREFHKTDLAIMNGGAIRGDKVYKKGDLTKNIITKLHPFGNSVAKIYITGKELRAFIETGLGCYEDLCGGFSQISGMTATISPTAPKGKRLHSLKTEDGKEITDNQNFTLAITDFSLANSPLKHNKLYGMTTLNDAVPILLTLYDTIEKAGSKCIDPKKDGRIKIV